jgi:polyisoprenoid-binding protein YceI
MSRLIWLVIATALLLAAPYIAHAKIERLGAPVVSFSAQGPMGMKIVGTTHDLVVSDDGKTINLKVALGNLSSGIALRDKHMKERYLQVAQHPEAALVFARTLAHTPEAGKELSGKLAARLTLHGASRDVFVSYRMRGKSDGVDVDATFSVNMNQFGIETPSYMGATVKPDVEIAAHFQVADR